MLLVLTEKQRCIIFYGISGSGKTWIAQFMRLIFDCHWKHQPKSIYEHRCHPDMYNKSLLIMNEASMKKLFANDDLHQMKLLTEGLGLSIESKYKHG